MQSHCTAELWVEIDKIPASRVRAMAAATHIAASFVLVCWSLPP